MPTRRPEPRGSYSTMVLSKDLALNPDSATCLLSDHGQGASSHSVSFYRIVSEHSVN